MKLRFNRIFSNTSAAVFLAMMLVFTSGCSKLSAETPVKKVKTLAVQKVDMAQSEAYAGKLKAAQEILISSKLSGKVAAVKYEIGDTVKKGDLLFSLDNNEIKAQQLQSQSSLGQAQANLSYTRDFATSSQKLEAKQKFESAKLQFNDAKNLLDRYKTLYESGAVSKKQMEDVEMGFNNAKLNLDRANESLKILESSGAPQSVSLSEAQLGSAKAAVELSNLQLDNSEIKSPIDGVVSMKNIDAGEMISAGAPAFAVVDNSYMEAELEVPAKTALQVRKGDTVDVRINLLALEKKGEIFAISPAADAKSGLYTVKIRLGNEHQTLKQGLIAEISFNLAKKSGVLTVPNQAILVEDGVEYVFINEKGVARKKAIKTGISDEKFTEVLDSISEGAEIVIEGQSFLNDGDKIKV
ncbi:MAG: efflux RND transporter periplasmic adaptor subunit [Clostridia bacterium]|nr:efflux RND transporter periplasmic adaptor subunit [Clostridia bacterium]